MANRKTLNRGMQDCFRKYPDVYGAEIADEEAAEQEAEQLARGTPAPEASSSSAPAQVPHSEPAHHEAEAPEDKPTPAAAALSPSSPVAKATGKDKENEETAQGPISEERGVPEKAFDATGANHKQ
jgi:mitochondrial intermembrane space import and assembly protein 40